jgi:uncharacterized protein YkwD
LVFALAGTAAAAEPVADPDRTAAWIVQQANGFRRDNGREPVARDERLEAAALEFARYMASTGKYSHTADGSTAGERARRHGYRWCRISENIAYQFDSRGFRDEDLGRKVLEGWERSADHRENLLDRDVTHTAVAVARSELTGYYYVVQMFGSACN